MSPGSFSLQNSSGLFPSTVTNRGTEPETMSNNAYTPAYMQQFVGKLMRVEFLIGTSLNERVGRLLEVGASYIVLQSLDPSAVIVCDLNSLRFATIIQDSSSEPPVCI